MVSTQVSFEFVRRLCTWLLTALLLSCLSPTLAVAQLSTEQTLEAERLGEEGVEAFGVGQYDKALEKLESGYDLSGWGTIGVWLAKTYEKVNRPLEALRVYSEVASSEAVAGEAAPFARAREEAQAAAARLEQSYAVIEFVSEQPVRALEVTIDGETRRVSKQGKLAVTPGESTVAASWDGNRLAPVAVTLQPGQHHVVELVAAPPAPSDNGAEGELSQSAISHSLDFSMVELTGWTLHDAQGNQICTLPCKWSGTDAHTLTVRHGEYQLPVRLGRRHARDPNIDVTVNPRRGSKGWALGLGIPAGVLFAGSLLALSESDYPALPAAGAGVFGAGFGVCVWWFLWSKNHPYLEYEVPAKAPPKKASIALDFYGNGLGVSGRF